MGWRFICWAVISQYFDMALRALVSDARCCAFNRNGNGVFSVNGAHNRLSRACVVVFSPSSAVP